MTVMVSGGNSHAVRMHIHVARDDYEAKFWLNPVSLASNHGYAPAELNRIGKLVEENCQKLLEAYIRMHGH